MGTDACTLRLPARLSLTRRLHMRFESGEIACFTVLLGNRVTVAQSFADVKQPYRSCRDTRRASYMTELVCFYYLLEHDRLTPACYDCRCMAYVRKSRRFRIYAAFFAVPALDERVAALHRPQEHPRHYGNQNQVGQRIGPVEEAVDALDAFDVAFGLHALHLHVVQQHERVDDKGHCHDRI